MAAILSGGRWVKFTKSTAAQTRSSQFKHKIGGYIRFKTHVFLLSYESV